MSLAERIAEAMRTSDEFQVTKAEAIDDRFVVVHEFMSPWESLIFTIEVHDGE